MQGVWRFFKLAARAAVWRTTLDPPLVGLPFLLGTAVIVAACRIALQLFDAGSWHAFNPYGLNAVVAWLAIELGIAALFVGTAGRATALSAMFVLSTAAESVVAAIKFGFGLLAPAAAQSAVTDSPITAPALAAVTVVWWIGAVTGVVQSLEARSRLRIIGKVAALWLALFVANALVPHAPVFLPPNFDQRSSNWWEVLYALYQDKTGTPAVSPEMARLEQAQPALLQAEVAQLAPQRKGTTDIYVLGIAGWAEQDVFAKELDGGLAAIAGVLPIKDRMLRLINNRATLETVPLASVQNFAAAVRAIGAIMDKDEDVLILLMTSHGERTGFALQVPGAVSELTPQKVAATLDGEGIKNRVVIVSACFAGIFVPPLANDNTIVMTASDAKNTSFGCAAGRDWTYFGDALFRQSLHPGADFGSAFEHARVLIHGWELMDHVQPSNPQGHFGQALVGKLAPIFTSSRSAGQ
jgi:hypothetical protein